MTIAPTQFSVRRLPVPACEPPYDDELAGASTRDHRVWPVLVARTPAPPVQGTLALSFVLPTGVPSTPVAPTGLRLLPALRPLPAAERDMDAAEFGPQPTSRAELPEPRGWAGRFAQAVVEVLAGDRPPAQLVRWTSTDVYDEVACRILPRSASGRVDRARGVVRSVHVSEPDDGVAEVAALVRRGARLTAVALRLEGLDGRWQCTAIELG